MLPSFDRCAAYFVKDVTKDKTRATLKKDGLMWARVGSWLESLLCYGGEYMAAGSGC